MTNQILAFVFITAMWGAAVVFVGRLERRERFRLRAAACVGCFYILTIGMMILVPQQVLSLRLIWRIVGMPILMVFIYVCWNLSISLCLYYGMWAFMAWQLLCELWIGLASFLQYVGKNSQINTVLLCVLVFVTGYLLIAITLAKWMPEDSKEKLGPRQLISAIVIFFSI